jgi:uncharacterized protein
MKVIVCADPADAGDIDGLIGALGGAGIEALRFEIGDDWEGREFRSLEAYIETGTHCLILWSGLSAGTRWLPFVVGHCASPGFRAALYRKAGSPELPAYLSFLTRIDTRDELVTFYAAERESWLVEHDRSVARRELLDLGLPVDNDSMADRAREGDIRALALYLRAGFSPNARDRRDVPVLCTAIRARHRRTAAFLISLGADADARSGDRGNSPLMDAAASGESEIIADLLAKRARVDVKSKNGQTALIIAVGRNDVRSSSFLLASGADPDDKDNLGYSARMYAKLFKDEEMDALFARYPERSGSSA